MKVGRFEDEGWKELTTERNRYFQSRLQRAALALDISLTRSRLEIAVPVFFASCEPPNSGIYKSHG